MTRSYRLRRKNLYEYPYHFYLSTKKAFAGDIQTQTALGLWYERFWTWAPNVEEANRNKEKALYWYTMAANQGTAIEKEQLATFYYHLGTDEATRQEYVTRAIYWYEQAAIQGLATAQYLLAYQYEIGEGVAEDEKKPCIGMKRRLSRATLRHRTIWDISMNWEKASHKIIILLFRGIKRRQTRAIPTVNATSPLCTNLATPVNKAMKKPSTGIKRRLHTPWPLPKTT